MTKVIEPSEIYKCLDLEDLPGEIWKDIQNFEGYYQISNIGRVKSVERLVDRGCQGKRIELGHVMKLSVTRKGYLEVECRKNSQRKIFKVHRLVAIHFIPNPENKPQVNHKKGFKWDNRVGEIEWATQSENMLHAHRTGLKKNAVGENHGLSKLTNVEVIEIRAKYKRNEFTTTMLSKEYGVAQTVIHSIVKFKTWKHV